MNELEIEKVKREIQLLDEELRTRRIRLFLDAGKTAAFGIAALIAFFLVTRPESEESRLRERAKLLIELSQQSNPARRSEGIAIVKSVYGESNNAWITSIESIMFEEARYNATFREPSAISDSLQNLIQDRRMLLDELRDELMREASGTGGTGIIGVGPVFEAKRDEVERVTRELDRYYQEYEDSLE